jgi:hypothetical protein
MEQEQSNMCNLVDLYTMMLQSVNKNNNLEMSLSRKICHLVPIVTLYNK